MSERSRIVILAAVTLALPSCERGASEPGSDQDATPLPVPAEEVTPSIIRPDVLPPAVEAAPEPLELTVPFADGGLALSEAAERALGELIESPQIAQGWPIVLRGHTDSVGHDEANLRVSGRRAEVVADWLAERGVDRSRIKIIPLGEQRPVAPNALPDGTPDEEGRARNRRVTVTVAPAGSEPQAGERQAEEPGAPPDG